MENVQSLSHFFLNIKPCDFRGNSFAGIKDTLCGATVQADHFHEKQ